MRNGYFIYNGINSYDYDIAVSGEGTWHRPQPDIKRIQVPGRNGDLIQLGNRYLNLDITYHCGIVENLRTNFESFNAALLRDTGYHRLEDSYNPEYYRMAVFEYSLDPDVNERTLTGEFDIKFNCKPQLFLKSGENEQLISNGGVINNPTKYTASPVIRFKLTNSTGGSITINGRTITAQNAVTSDYIIIDCEREDIYLAGNRQNMNNCFTLSTGEFFELLPGNNTISFTGIYQGIIYITPNWWTV